MEHLGGLQRTKESSVGAVVDVASGIKQMILPNRSKGEGRLKGAARIGEGVFNALDIVPSAIADGTRAAIGPDRKQGSSDYNYNISRGFGSFRDMEKPQHAVSAVVDNIHAIGFRAGTDIMRLIGGRGKNRSFKQAA